MGSKQWGMFVALVAAVLILGQVGSCQHDRAVAFEARAKAAEEHSRLAQVDADLYRDEAARLYKISVTQDSVIAHARVSVAAVDSQHPPDTSCAPNLAARDHVIEAQASDIVTLHGITDAQDGALRILQASKDELAKALASRPSSYPRFVGPNIGLGVFAGPCGINPAGKPAFCVGIGVSVNLFSARLR